MRAPARPATRPAIAALAVAALAALAACTDPPRPPDTAAERGTGYPALIPAQQITGRVPPAAAHADPASDLAPRAARLRARAARLGGPVIDAETRNRMQTGVTR